MKRIGRILVVALFASAVWTSSANAAASFFTVTIDMIGMANATTLVMRLSDTASTPAFTNQAFVHSGETTKEMLATGLTAFALDSPVFVLTDPDSASVPEAIRMLIQK